MCDKIKKIRSYSFAGGGFFGYSQVAALKELEEKFSQYLDIQEVRGSSVGSMVASLYAVGYSPAEMTTILHEMDFDNLIRDNYFAYYNLYNNLGMYHANKLEDEMERLIKIKTNIKFCTFSQIQKDLIIIATNLNYQCAKFLDRKNTPDLPISKAIRMSIGYPGIMKPALFEGDYYSDGGETINYPLTTIDIDKLDEAIGITFAAYNENPNGTLKTRIPINNISDFFKSLGVTLSRATYTAQISEQHLRRSIIIYINDNISSMQFNLTKEQKQFIYDCGIKAVQEQIYDILEIANDKPINNTINLEQPIEIKLESGLIIDPFANLEKLLENLESAETKPVIPNELSIEPVIEAIIQSALLK